MIRNVLRRLAFIPPALLLANFLGYAYARVAQRYQLARNPFLAVERTSEPLLPDYFAYLGRVLRLDFGVMPGGETIPEAFLRYGKASLGLVALAFVVCVVAGIILGLLALRTTPPRVSPWLTAWTTFGNALPSFYAGSLLIVGSLYYALWKGPGTTPPFPLQGFGWDIHLVLPVLALMARPMVQIAHLTSGFLAGELRKQYVVAARAVGHTWRTINWRLAMRNVIAPVILTIAQSLRLLIAELILVEWLFTWPGLGRLLAQTLVPSRMISSTGVDVGGAIFLNPYIIAALLMIITLTFLLTDLVASLLTQRFDPRLRAVEEEANHG